MTNVTLKEFRFALPMVVKKSDLNNPAENLECSTDFPQEFFGLTDKQQVAVISGLITAVLSLGKTGINNASDKLLPAVMFPLHIGIGVTVKNNPNLSIETQFTLPDHWKQMRSTLVIKAIDSIAYLLQGTAISIVKRAGQSV